MNGGQPPPAPLPAHRRPSRQHPSSRIGSQLPRAEQLGSSRLRQLPIQLTSAQPPQGGAKPRAGWQLCSPARLRASLRNHAFLAANKYGAVPQPLLATTTQAPGNPNRFRLCCTREKAGSSKIKGKKNKYKQYFQKLSWPESSNAPPREARGDVVALPGPPPQGWVAAAGTLPAHTHDRVGDEEETSAQEHTPR